MVSFNFLGMLGREDDRVLRRTLDFEVEVRWKKGRRRRKEKKGRPKRTWKRQDEKESVKVGLRRKDALFQSKWSVGLDKNAAGLS